jgi:hypothetical protein
MQLAEYEEQSLVGYATPSDQACLFRLRGLNRPGCLVLLVHKALVPLPYQGKHTVMIQLVCAIIRPNPALDLQPSATLE